MAFGGRGVLNFRVKLLIAGTALATATVVSSGQAQQATGNSSAAQLQPIILEGGSAGPVGPDKTIVAKDTATGTKTDSPIVDISASVSVVTEKELEERKVDNLQQAVAYTSSVFTDEFGNDDRYDYIRIRGFDQTTLGTYRDGLAARIPAFFTASRLEPYGLQRVEVLKGSTSTLFGLNGPGGLVNAITKRPQDEKFGEVYTSYGDGTKEVGVDFGGPIDPDGVWTYRFTGLGKNGDLGWDYSNDDRIYIAPALTIKPDEGTSLTILTDFYKRDGTGARGFPTGADVDINTFIGEPDFNRFNTKQTDIGYQFEHELNDNLTFRQNARYSHVSLDYAEVYGASLDPDDPRTAFTVDGRSNRYAIDNQLQYDTDWHGGASKTLFGIDYANDNTRERIFWDPAAGGIDIHDPVYCGASCINLVPYQNWRVRQQALGIYAQEELTLDDRWIFTLGGRWDHVNTKADYYLDGTQDDNTASAFTKRVGVTYKFTPNLAAYANYSESFQPIVTPTGNGYALTGTLKPQEGEQYEIGLKYRPDGFDGLFTLAFFDLTQTNVPSWISDLEQRQIGKVGVRGVEFEGKAAIADNLNLTLAYSYWDAEIKEDGTDNVGNRPSRVPRHLASAWLDYTIPGDGWRGDLNFGGGVRYIGQTYGDDENTVSNGGYATFDAAIKYKVTKDVSLALNATNLFDRKYVATSYYGTEYYGDRRKVVGTLKYSW
ncbi:TonB-dependent siderophore receptor [Neorhizobium sp. NCHU2750]|uniref:TonB-dependent siderophore receptor n=1 Tax=Neorhizobium sp. NCHU2750 TaxID=1825976 RepID=UPI000E7617F9|nr:iron complex outermembrane recepter protein [Neorhizobium sp. NCHU2750]